jgi:hypothetical protein
LERLGSHSAQGVSVTQTSELSVLHRSVDGLRASIDSVRHRYGEIPAVKRLLGDVERIDLDAAELDDVVPPTRTADGPVQLIDDRPSDPALWAGADDEGIGGHHR